MGMGQITVKGQSNIVGVFCADLDATQLNQFPDGLPVSSTVICSAEALRYVTKQLKINRAFSDRNSTGVFAKSFKKNLSTAKAKIFKQKLFQNLLQKLYRPNLSKI